MIRTHSYSYFSTYFIVLAYKVLFSSYFQQHLLILSKISKIENLRWRPSVAILDFLFVTMVSKMAAICGHLGFCVGLFCVGFYGSSG